jgi:hypothetical protein
VRGGIVGGVEKANGTTPGPGWRVWKLRVNRANRLRLKTLYDNLINYAFGILSELKGSKYLTYYVGEWIEMFENVKRMREEAGKRTLPKTPPLPLLVRFIMPDGQERGNKCATCVIDLRRGELRIPSYGVVQKLPCSLVRALVEENNLNPRPEFVLQVTRKGFLRLIASRAPPPKQSGGLLLVCMDENLGHGLYTTLISFDSEKVKVTRGPTFKPPNAALLRGIAAQLQGAADTGTTAALRTLIEKAYEELGEKREVEGGSIRVSPDRARELKRRIGAKERRLNEEWKARVTSWLRKLIRGATARVVVLVDEIALETVRKSGLIRWVSERLRNLCTYEGAEYLPLRASGKYCPRCNAKGGGGGPSDLQVPKMRSGVAQRQDGDLHAGAELRQDHGERGARKALLEWLNEHPRALSS